jgi:hypothetical protein
MLWTETEPKTKWGRIHQINDTGQFHSSEEHEFVYWEFSTIVDKKDSPFKLNEMLENEDQKNILRVCRELKQVIQKDQKTDWFWILRSYNSMEDCLPNSE